MKKSDLKNRMVVECRNGNRYIVINYIIINYYEYIDLVEYTDDLKNKKVSKFDIVKTYDTIPRLDWLDYPERWILLWERSEVKEITMAEVEEKFGCKVKIVKEK